jgi:hypothetical protein
MDLSFDFMGMFWKLPKCLQRQLDFDIYGYLNKYSLSTCAWFYGAYGQIRSGYKMSSFALQEPSVSAARQGKLGIWTSNCSASFMYCLASIVRGKNAGALPIYVSSSWLVGMTVVSQTDSPAEPSLHRWTEPSVLGPGWDTHTCE